MNLHGYGRVNLDERVVKNPPVMGWAEYIVLKKTDKAVTLFHAPTLETVDLPRVCRKSGFNFDKHFFPAQDFPMKRLANRIEATAKTFDRNNLQFSGVVVRQVLAELRGIPLDQVPEVKTPRVVEGEEKKAKAPKPEKAPKGPGVIETIFELITDKWVSLGDLCSTLHSRFPDRDPEKLMNTIKTQLTRIPRERGVALERDKDKGRVRRAKA